MLVGCCSATVDQMEETEEKEAEKAKRACQPPKKSDSDRQRETQGRYARVCVCIGGCVKQSGPGRGTRGDQGPGQPQNSLDGRNRISPGQVWWRQACSNQQGGR